MKIISFTSQKGGVGKSTDATNIAVGFGKKGKKVLVIDGDPQANTTDNLAPKENGFTDAEIELIKQEFDETADPVSTLNHFFNLEKKEHPYSLSDILMDPVLAPEAVVPTRYENVDLIPATLDLVNTDKLLKMETLGISNRLRKALKAVEKSGKSYDYVIIDYAPTSNTITLNSYIITGDDGRMIIPVKIDKAGIKGLLATLNDMKDVQEKSELDLSYDYLIHFTMVNRNKNDQKIIDLIHYLFKDHVLQQQIRYQAKPVSTASLENKALIDTDSPVADDYLALIDEIEAVLEQ